MSQLHGTGDRDNYMIGIHDRQDVVNNMFEFKRLHAQEDDVTSDHRFPIALGFMQTGVTEG